MTGWFSTYDKMDERNSVQSIIDALAKMAAEKKPIDPQMQMEAASKINVLMQGEMEKLALLENQLAKMRNAYLIDGKSSAYAKSMVEGTDEYLAWRIQDALVKTGIEQIRTSKKHAGLLSDLMRNNL
jgi:hypothetical protein